jgi:hypothetical protein
MRNTSSPTPGVADNVDPWESDVTSTNNDSSWEDLASRRETPTPAQLDLCNQIEREHEADVRSTQFSKWEMEKYHVTQWYIMELELLRMQFNSRMGNLRRRFGESDTASD